MCKCGVLHYAQKCLIKHYGMKCMITHYVGICYISHYAKTCGLHIMQDNVQSYITQINEALEPVELH